MWAFVGDRVGALDDRQVALGVVRAHGAQQLLDVVAASGAARRSAERGGAATRGLRRRRRGSRSSGHLPSAWTRQSYARAVPRPRRRLSGGDRGELAGRQDARVARLDRGLAFSRKQRVQRRGDEQRRVRRDDGADEDRRARCRSASRAPSQNAPMNRIAPVGSAATIGRVDRADERLVDREVHRLAERARRIARRPRSCSRGSCRTRRWCRTASTTGSSGSRSPPPGEISKPNSA